MYKIEIGAGFVVTALAGFSLLGSLPANIILVTLGGALIFHGSYEVFFKPRMFLSKRLGKWLLSRNWKIRMEKTPPFDFIIWAEDDSRRELAITKSKEAKGMLVFTAAILKGEEWGTNLAKLRSTQRKQLIEDIICSLLVRIWPTATLSGR